VRPGGTGGPLLEAKKYLVDKEPIAVPALFGCCDWRWFSAGESTYSLPEKFQAQPKD
jgi:hypothetical protein